MSKHKSDPALVQLLADTETYLRRYVTFANPDYSFVGALWAAGTYLWPYFDAFGYLCISSTTKRSGKTRFSEVLSFVCSNPANVTGMTAAAIFRSINDEKPTLILDEAEGLSGDSLDDTLRAVLNAGYRRGQTVRRIGKNGLEDFPVYCPKVFVLIGDVRDTLRDRSIVILMQRGEAPRRFVYEPAKAEGAEVGERLKNALEGQRQAIAGVYTTHDQLTFLPDRDAEIWLPLFAICQVMAPHRLTDLQRIAVDMATEKTVGIKRHTNLQGAEREAEDDEYSKRLVRDLLEVMGTGKHVWTNDALPKLFALPTGPWRKFRGDGLSPHDMSNMLKRHGIQPKSIRVGGKKNGTVRRGYSRDAVAKLVREWDAARAEADV